MSFLLNDVFLFALFVVMATVLAYTIAISTKAFPANSAKETSPEHLINAKLWRIIVISLDDVLTDSCCLTSLHIAKTPAGKPFYVKVSLNLSIKSDKGGKRCKIKMF